MRMPWSPKVMFTPPLWIDFSFVSITMPGRVMSTVLPSAAPLAGVLVMRIAGVVADAGTSGAAGGSGGAGTDTEAGGEGGEDRVRGCEEWRRPESTTVSV